MIYYIYIYIYIHTYTHNTYTIHTIPYYTILYTYRKDDHLARTTALCICGICYIRPLCKCICVCIYIKKTTNIYECYVYTYHHAYHTRDPSRSHRLFGAAQVRASDDRAYIYIYICIISLYIYNT